MHKQKETVSEIGVRLPNWLGDVVMSLGFLHVLRQTYPSAIISVIIKKGLEELVAPLPSVDTVFVFSKGEYKGLRGVWRFGKAIQKKKQFDLFFVLPDSLSAAIMSFATGAMQRIGYRKEGRSIFLTRAYPKRNGLHRVEEYVHLIYRYQPNSEPVKPQLHLPKTISNEDPYIVLNINSEATSRRLPIEKAVALIALLQAHSLPIKLIGSPREKEYADEVYGQLVNKQNVEVVAGKTNMRELVTLIQNATLMISTDSGPAHIASASGTPLVVMFGAGNENNTGPYENNNAVVVRNGKLPCEPCVRNKCKLATLPVCMVQLNLQKITIATDILFHKHEGYFL